MITLISYSYHFSNAEQTLSEHQKGDSSEDEGVESSPEEIRPEKKIKLSNRALVKNYPIDFMANNTTIDELNRLRKVYNIPNDVDLKVPSKKDTSSRPLKDMSPYS